MPATISSIIFIVCLALVVIILTYKLSHYFLSKKILQPIKKIADEITEISAQNFTRRIPTDNTFQEYHNLTVTINELLDRLQESFEIQSRFISNASHELSNPLSAISSQLEVSLQRDRNAEEYKNVMQSVYQDVLHLNKLMQTLLEFAKASGTAMGLEISLLRIDEILLKIKSEISKIDTQYSVILEFNELPEEEEGLLIFGNEKLLFTAINNIVINACKYSTNNRAMLKLSIHNNEILITISDEGKGIEKEELEKIFQPFYRAENNLSMPGSGLGLMLASRMIKLHKGHIEVNSIINQGTTFTLILPSAKAYKNL